MHRPFNRLICKRDDVICVERRMDLFKTEIVLRGIFKDKLLELSYLSFKTSCASFLTTICCLRILVRHL